MLIFKNIIKGCINNQLVINILILFVFFSFNAKSQQISKLDSLKNCLHKQINDLERIKTLNQLAWETKNIFIDSSFIYAEQAKELSVKLNDKNGLAEAYRNLANYYYIKGNINISETYYTKSLKLYEDLNNMNGKANCFVGLGNILSSKSEFIKSLDYYQKALKIYQNEKNNLRIGVCFSNISEVYFWLKDYNNALKYASQATEIFKELRNNHYLANSYLGTSNIYKCINNYKMALELIQIALTLKSQIKDRKAISDIYKSMGEIYGETENFDSAFFYINKSLEIKKELNDLGGIAWLYNSISRLYIKNKDYNSALEKNNEGLKKANLIGDRCLRLEVYDNYRNIYQNLENYKKAYNFQQKYILLRDSIKGDEIKAKIKETEQKDEIEKQEESIGILKSENEFKTRQIAKNKQITWLWVIISLLLTILAIYSFIAYRNKRKISNLLKEQNDEISAQRDYISSQRDIIEKELTENILKSEKLQRENLQYKLEALKNQLNPHFLFNTFSTLISLIPENQNLAEKYARNLSNVYRYILNMHDNELASINEELEFINAYMFMVSTRFDNKVALDIRIDEKIRIDYIPSFSLQLLVENAIKHNIISSKRPLKITIQNLDKKLCVKNNLQKKTSAENSTGIGLNNIISRYKFLSHEIVEIICTEEEFVVKLPIIFGNVKDNESHQKNQNEYCNS
jgi:sensor histidine kinase YesM